MRSRKRWGGKRRGAGRKSLFQEPHPFAFVLETKDFEALETIARDQEISTGALLREIVDDFLKRSRS